MQSPSSSAMATAPPCPFQTIPAAAAADLIRSEADLTLFDVRDVASYQRGHIDGAMHLAEPRLPLWLGRLPKNAPIVIYCYHGNASQACAAIFSDFRFTRVYSVDGGYAPLAAAMAPGPAHPGSEAA